MGLLTLCCTKGDKGHDSQGPPARLVQVHPENSTQNISPAVANDALASYETPGNMRPEETIQEKLAQQSLVKRDLWKEAFDNLDSSEQRYVAESSGSATAAIKQVIDDTTAKYEQWLKGGLKIHRKNGDDISIRDCSERILGAAMRAGEVMSTAVSFDPTGQASSAWAIISFGMSVIQNRIDRRDAIFAASEYLAETLSYYALIDTNYRNQNVGSDEELDKALLYVYSAILKFTAEVKKGRDEAQGKRTLQSVLALTDQPLQALKEAINSQSETADKWIKLSASLGDHKRAEEHLAKTEAIFVKIKALEEKALDAEEQAKLTWISNAPYSDRQRILQKKRASDTGIWLLDSPEYNDWKTTSGSVLWLPGVSGCGKSVLCSTIIQDIEEDCLSDPSKRLGYWYFEFGIDATKSADTMVRSLIRQLSRSPLSHQVTNLWEDHYLRGSQPDSKAIFAVLHDLLSCLTSDVYLVFDALDECPQNEKSKERGSVLDFLEDLLQRYNTKVPIHILVTSRLEQDIKRRLDRFSKIDLEAHLSKDVKTFVDSCLASEPLMLWKPEIRNLITYELLNSTERRFRWAELQILALERCHKEDQIRKRLKAIPQTLEATYRMVLDNIDPEDYSTAREILTILCLSPVVFDAQTIVNMVGLSFSSALVDICTTSFINLIDGKVQLAHFSVREFLVVLEETAQHHSCQFSAVNGHNFLTEKTVSILLEQTEILNETTSKESDKAAFLYSAKNWSTHMNAAGGIFQLSPELQTKIEQLFTQTNVYWNWVRAAEDGDGSVDSEWTKLFEECQPPIHRASMLGLAPVVSRLLAQGANPYQTFMANSSQSNSIKMASQFGNCDVLHVFFDQLRPLGERHEAALILRYIDHRKVAKAEFTSVLQKLWDLGLLRDYSSDLPTAVRHDVVMYIMSNQNSAAEIMKILFDSQPKLSIPIPSHALLRAILVGTELLDVFLECSDAHIPPDFIHLVEKGSRYEDGTQDVTMASGICLLAVKRPDELPVTNLILELLAEGLGLEEMKALIQARKSDLTITETVLEVSAKNKKSARILSLLWPDRDTGVVVNETMLCNAVANENNSRELLVFMQKHIDPSIKLSEETMNKLVLTSQSGVATLQMLSSLGLSSDLAASERMIQSICSHREATDMLSLLIESGFDIPITESVLRSAASNQFQAQGISVIECLAKLSQKPLPTTESVIVAAVQNLEQDEKMLAVVLKYAPATFMTDKVFEEACENERAMLLLLDGRQEDLPIDNMILKIADGGYPSKGVLRALLERHLIKINETLVQELAANFHALHALLIWEPNSPITERALMIGAKDPRSMRLLLGAEGGASHVTEEVMMAALLSSDRKSVMHSIFHRRGSLDVTDEVLRVFLKENKLNWDSSFMSWFLQQTPESVITALLLWDNWQNEDLWMYDSRCSFLLAFARKTVSRINSLMKDPLPFDPMIEEISRLNRLIENPRYRELVEIPASELAAVVLVENCYNETIEQIWDQAHLTSTDRVIEGVERNRIADKEKLKSFLEGKRA